MEAEDLLAEAVRELDAEVGSDVGLAREAYQRFQEEKHRIEEMVSEKRQISTFHLSFFRRQF